MKLLNTLLLAAATAGVAAIAIAEIDLN